MKNLKIKFLNISMGMLLVLSSFGNITLANALDEATVNTEAINTIEIETPANSSTTTTNSPETSVTSESTVPETEVTTEDVTSTDSNLKEDLYSGSIIVDKGVTVDGVFEKLIVKGRNLVENVRKAIIPWLVLAWIGLFGISVLRILTGERGASSRLVGGLILITVAYCGIVYAELFISGMVKFFVG